MFLAVVTNQEIMDVLQLLKGKSSWEIILNTCAPIIASLLTLFISSYTSRKQMEKQFQNERDKIKEDRGLQLKAEERAFIDRESIKKITELLKKMREFYLQETFQIKTLSMYYGLKNINMATEEVKQETLKKILSFSINDDSKYHECRSLLAFADRDIAEDFETFASSLQDFNVEQIYLQYDYLKDGKKPEREELLSPDKVDELYKKFIKDFARISQKMNDELRNYIENSKRID
ncbi:hypothetical protein [Liquorilactobacillus satsumensis]|nr:hypothetical protein [Liquorilactobacillus satsumensis]